MSIKSKKSRGYILSALSVVLLVALCVFSSACATKKDSGSESRPEQNVTLPDIVGPVGQTVLEGYGSFSSEKFTVSGESVTVSADIPAKAGDKIEWNNESCRLYIASGLSVGEYTVTLTVTNGDMSKNKTAEYVLIVKECVPPSITAEKGSLSLIEGYEAASSPEFTVTGTSVTVSAECNDKNAENKIVWNDAAKRLDIGEGLAIGNYTVVLTATNGNPAMNATIEYRIIVTPLPNVVGESEIVLLGSDYEQTVYTYSANGKGIAITKKSGDERIVWNAEELTLTVCAGLECGEYKVELVASNGESKYDSVFEIGVFVKRLYTLTGSYEYGSGRYDAASGKYTNDGDNITVKVGSFEATVDEVNQTYTVEKMPDGEYEVVVESDYFRSVTVTAEVSGENDVVEIAEKATLKNPEMQTQTGVIYDGDYLTVEGNTAALFSGNSVTEVGEGFVVKYTLPTNGSKGWFNRGGLHVKTNADERNEHDFGLVSTGKVWGVYAKQSGVKDRDNLSLSFAEFVVDDVWNVTVVYSDGVYYMSYVSEDKTKTYSAAYPAQSFAYVKGGEITSASVTRALGLSSYCDSNFGTVFKDVTYSIGNEIAKEAVQKLPEYELRITVAGDTKVALPNAEAKNGEGVVIDYTVVDNGSTAWLRRGGLYITATENGTESKYRFGIYQGGLYIRMNEKNDYYTSLKIHNGTWKVTIAFYGGVYYMKFASGETVYTMKLDPSSRGDLAAELTTEMRDKIFSFEATRSLSLHSYADNNASTEFGKVTYSIGNDAATAAIKKMGFNGQ